MLIKITPIQNCKYSSVIRNSRIAFNQTHEASMSTFNIKFFTPVEVAQLLGVKVQTLSVWRCHGRYPELQWHKFGRRIRYSEQDVYSFIQSSLVVSGAGL